jgi:flagellar biogenesis protein FliO
MKQILICICLMTANMIYAQSVDELRQKAAQGDATAQNELGNIYDYVAMQDYGASVKRHQTSTEQGNTVGQSNSDSIYEDGYEDSDFSASTTEDLSAILEDLIPWIILILSVIMFFMLLARQGVPRQGTSYIISNTLFLSVCTLEIVYLLSIANFGLPHFCDPNEVGWMWTIINFLLFGGIVVNQILYLKDVIGDVFTKVTPELDFLWLGVLAWMVAIVAMFICGFFFKGEGIPWVLGGLCLFQIIQIILIFKNYGKNIKGACFASFVYLLGLSATAGVTMILAMIVIIIALVCAVLWLVLKLTGIGQSSSGGGFRRHYADGSTEDFVEDGRGICGEKYYKGDRGNTETKF